ncbi:MAG: hypothetical protein R3B70_46590 [Polyangiaceae bacterium]
MSDDSSCVSFSCRPSFYADVEEATWCDWRWQQRSLVHSTAQLEDIYPGFAEVFSVHAAEWRRRSLRFGITPYLLSLVRVDEQGLPDSADPIFRQFFPVFEELTDVPIALRRRPVESEARWVAEERERPGESLTPICHWTYDHRVTIDSSDRCLAYCTFCVRSLRADAVEQKTGGLAIWRETMEAIRARPAIREVVLSGGEPLAYSNLRLGQMLRDLRRIPSVRTIEIHTRALTHNPYRVDDELCALFRRYGVSKVGAHIVHPAELSPELRAAVSRVRELSTKTAVASHHVVVKGVNDDDAVLRELFTRLSSLGVRPQVLFHMMPDTPAPSSQRTSLRRTVHLFNLLRAHVSTDAMPELALAHDLGALSVPPDPEGTPSFRYLEDPGGQPTVRFKDRRGEWTEYLDAVD